MINETIIYKLENGVAHLTLNRPDKYNAFNRSMAFCLQQHLDNCATNEEVRCILITGNGKAFCSGQDLAEVVDPEGPKMNRILSEHYNPLVRKMRQMPKPIVVAVNGVAAGAGANLAFCADVLLVAQSAKFIQAFSKIGLIPDTGGTYILPRLIGFQKASALMMLGDTVTAVEAEKMGMVYKVYEDENLLPEATKVAEQLAAMPTKALGLIKKALNSAMIESLDEQLNTEDSFQQKAAATDDFKEGVAAFLEKRKPNFLGK
jgi:2-(1,2-epoxy-1,2-dihydrophenyl)acetyl-CoA isomerase